MLAASLLFTALSLGQIDAPPVETRSGTPKAESVTPTAASISDRWPLMKVLQGTTPGILLDTQRLVITGWTQGSFTASTAEHENLPMGFNYRANEFLLQQNWLRLERTVVTSGTTAPTFGFRNDWILPGSDYRFTLPRGLFNYQLTDNDGKPNIYGFDPVQCYGEGYFPTLAHGTDVKVGRFLAPFGIEAVPTVENPLISHAYTFIYNPFTFTGAIATLNLTPVWTTQLALITGGDMFFAQGMEPTFFGNILWAPPKLSWTAKLSLLVNSGRYYRPTDWNNPNLADLVVTHQINTRLSYALETLIGWQTHVPDQGNVYWLGLIQYLTCDVTRLTRVGARLEFFHDPSGNRTGSPGLYTDATVGVGYRPWHWMLLRQEIRCDYNTTTPAFDGNYGLFTAASDVVLRW